MVDKDKRVKVINRTGGGLAYSIDALRVSRYWPKPGHHLNISIAELSELRTVPGGTKMLEECLLIEDLEALKILFPDSELEPEYNYGVEEVEFLLQEASLEQLLDALDYAPHGVLDLIKSQSVKKLPNETSKISAINEKFNIDINKMHELHLEKSIPEEKPEPKRRRRTAPIVEPKEQKETSLPKYNVVKKED